MNKRDEVIGYEFVNLGRFTDELKSGVAPGEAIKKALGIYGHFKNAVKYIDPRKE